MKKVISVLLLNLICLSSFAQNITLSDNDAVAGRLGGVNSHIFGEINYACSYSYYNHTLNRNVNDGKLMLSFKNKSSYAVLSEVAIIGSALKIQKSQNKIQLVKLNSSLTQVVFEFNSPTVQEKSLTGKIIETQQSVNCTELKTQIISQEKSRSIISVEGFNLISDLWPDENGNWPKR